MNLNSNFNPTNELWRDVERLLSADRSEFGLERTFPADSVRISLIDALAREDVPATTEHRLQGEEIHDSLDGLLKQLGVFENISRCPILAITGLLNAGKSSLLATYLTPENRKRVLRGLGNNSGTHRFVLWLPEAWWNDADLLSTLISFLSSLFGHPPEHLSSDPEIAALQYNGKIVDSALMRAPTGSSPEQQEGPPQTDNSADPMARHSSASVDPLSVPLIAYDAGLDELKLGLIDCPDIQTGFLDSGNSSQRGRELADQRQHQLGIIGRLCSAFVVVCKLNSLHDEGLTHILTTLRDAMPGVPRLLAVNKVKARYATEVVYEQARVLADRFGIRSIYAAYDFRSALASSRVPPPPPRWVHTDPGKELPIFFEVGNAGGAPAQHATTPSYLHNLGEHLDAGTLSRESCRSLLLQLRTKAAAAIQWIEENQRLRETQVQDGWQAIAHACYEFMAERDTLGNAVGLRLQASPAIVSQMADSLQRTAPMWLRLSLSIDRTARQLQQAVANSTARFKILQNASESVTRFTKRFKRGEGAQVVTPERLATAIRSSDAHDALHAMSQETLVGRCETAMQRFAEEDKTLLNQDELDQWSRQVWESMSFKDKLWRGTQPLAVMLGPLLAAVLVPFDGGGTAVLVFASAKELLAAAGIALVTTAAGTGGETLKIVHRETPWRQLSDLFALACDSIGLPRPADTELPSAKCVDHTRQLLPSGLVAKPTPEPAVCVWQLNAELTNQLHLSLKRLT